MELRQVVGVLWRRSWLIILAAIFAGGSSFLYTRNLPPVYQATATLVISYGNNPLGVATGSTNSSDSLAATFNAQLASPALAGKIVQAAGLNVLSTDLPKLVQVDAVNSTQLLRVTATADRPDVAARLANQTANALVAEISDDQQARYQSLTQTLQAQLSALETQITDTQKAQASLGDPKLAASGSIPELTLAESARLQSQLSDLQLRHTILLQNLSDVRLSAARDSDSMRVYAPADPPRLPTSNQVLLRTLLGAAAGLALGVFGAFLLEYLDDTLKDSDQVEAALGLDSLGTVRRGGVRKGPLGALVALGDAKSLMAEDYRIVRTGFQFAVLANGSKSVVITSTVPGEGKTMTTANLGVALAQAGKRVILVDTDLRRPSLHQLFNVAPQPGFTNLFLDRECTPERVLRETTVPGLSLLPSGTLPPNPADVLSAPRTAELIKLLEDRADFVLYDSPPILPVADARALASHTRSAVLVTAQGEVRSHTILQAVTLLQRVDARVLGVILNKSTQRGDAYYYRYYPSAPAPNGKVHAPVSPTAGPRGTEG